MKVISQMSKMIEGSSEKMSSRNFFLLYLIFCYPNVYNEIRFHIIAVVLEVICPHKSVTLLQ